MTTVNYFRRMAIGLILLTIVMSGALAETVIPVLNVNVRSTRIDDFRRPGAVTLSLMVQGTAPVRGRLMAELKRNGRRVAITRFSDMEPLMLPAGMSLHDGRDIIPLSAVEFYGDDKDIVLRTGMISPGAYELCVSLHRENPDGGDGGIYPGSQACRMMNLTGYPAPTILWPSDGEVVDEKMSGKTIRWTPVAAGMTVRYQVMVIPRYEGQSINEAKRDNPPVLNRSVMAATSLMVTPDVHFPGNVSRYLVMVGAFDERGNALSGEGGYGESNQFMTASEEISDRATIRFDSSAHGNSRDGRPVMKPFWGKVYTYTGCATAPDGASHCHYYIVDTYRLGIHTKSEPKWYCGEGPCTQGGVINPGQLPEIAIHKIPLTESSNLAFHPDQIPVYTRDSMPTVKLHPDPGGSTWLCECKWKQNEKGSWYCPPTCVMYDSRFIKGNVKHYMY